MNTPSNMAWGQRPQQQMESPAYVSASQPRTRFCTHTLPSAGEILSWLERNAESVFIQQTGRRPKNRAVVQYREGNEVKAVGGVTIAAAVQKAKLRQQDAGISAQTQ
jgi:hypothetical protein